SNATLGGPYNARGYVCPRPAQVSSHEHHRAQKIVHAGRGGVQQESVVGGDRPSVCAVLIAPVLWRLYFPPLVLPDLRGARSSRVTQQFAAGRRTRPTERDTHRFRK